VHNYDGITSSYYLETDLKKVYTKIYTGTPRVVLGSANSKKGGYEIKVWGMKDTYENGKPPQRPLGVF
jgi:hypothetical protein